MVRRLHRMLGARFLVDRLYEPIARMAVVVDPVLVLQPLNLPEVRLGMRAHAIQSVKQRLFETVWRLTTAAQPRVVGTT